MKFILILLVVGLPACGIPDISEKHLALVDKVNSVVQGGSESKGACGSVTGRGGVGGGTIAGPTVPLMGGYGSGEFRFCSVSGEGSKARVGLNGEVTIEIGGQTK